MEEEDIERELQFPPLVGEEAMEVADMEGNVENNSVEKSEVVNRPESSLHKELLDSIQAVKEKLRARLPVKLTIIKVEVDGLPKVHRFVRNKPWVKAQYGVNYSWSADYIESETGDHALWNNVDWSFTIERNQRDRQDLVVAICSKDIIIGRYVLGRDEISDLAESAIANHLQKQDDGEEAIAEDFISIEGEVINALGSAGKIHILCSRKVQEGFLPDINEASVAGNFPSSVLLDSPSRSPRPGSPSFESYVPLFSYHEVTVRLLAVAVMDLQSVHYFQSNSPTVCIDVGSYVNITETKVNAGMAARWTDLYWRFTVSRDHGMIVTVVSNSVLVGKCIFATEELISVAPNAKGIISLIKLLSNGRELTGKVKISLIINHPEDMFAPAASLSANVRESIYPRERLDVDRSVPSDIIRSQDSVDLSGGMMDQASEEQKGDLRTASQSRVLNDDDLEGTLLAPQSRPHSPQSSAVLDVLPTKMRIKNVPFTVVVQEVTVLDVKWPSSMTFWIPLGQKSLRLHLGCGLYAFSTDEMRTNGRFAHWLDMVWKLPVVADTNCLRITLWSHSTNLGEASLHVKDLLGMPTTKTGRTEIFAKIHNEANEIAGRVRIACHYERGNTAQADKDVHRVNGAITTLKSYNSASPNRSMPAKTLSSMQNTTANASGAAAAAEIEAGNSVASPGGSKAQTTDEPFVPSFPLLVHVRSIALVDVMVGQSSSILFRPTIRVQMVCDRKQAVTDEVRPMGGAAKFEQMEWRMHVRQDSYLAIIVQTKQGATVGKAEIPTGKLIDQPFLSGGAAQITLLLKKDGVTVGKTIISFGLKNAEVIPDADSPLAAKPPRVELDSASLADNVVGGGSHVMSGVFHQESVPQLYVRDAREETMQLLNSSNQLPRMPWNTGSADESVNGFNQSRIFNGGGSVRTHGNKSYGDLTGSVVFDPRLLSAVPSKKAKQFFDFHIAIHEVDLWDILGVSTKQNNTYMVSAACGKWATSTPIQNAIGNACYWTKLNWKCHIVDRQTKFRLTIHIRNKIVGACFFSIDDLMDTNTDNSGYKRLQGLVQDSNGQGIGKVKVSYVLDVQKKNTIGQLNSIANIPSNKLRPENSQFGQMSFMKIPDQMPSYIQTSSVEEPMVGSGLELDDESLAAAVEFPCTFVLCELSAFELMPVHSVGKNVPSIKVHCGNFYQTTPKSTDGLELINYVNLNWVFPVDASSTVTFTLVSKDTALIGAVELEVSRIAKIPPNVRGFREIMMLVKRGGLSSGKLVVRAKLLPLIETFHDNIPSASPSVRENPAPFMLPPINQGSIMSAENSVVELPPPGQAPLNTSMGSSTSHYSTNIYASKRYSSKAGVSAKQPQVQQQNTIPQNIAASYKAQPTPQQQGFHQMPQQMYQQTPQQMYQQTPQQMYQQTPQQMYQMSTPMLTSNPGSPKSVRAPGYSVKSPPSVSNYQQHGGTNTYSAGNDMAQSHLAPSYRNSTKSSRSPQSMLSNNLGMEPLQVIDRSDQPSQRMQPPSMYANDAPVYYDPQQAQNLVDSPDDMSYLGGMSVGSRVSRGRADSYNDNRDLSGHNTNNNNNNSYNSNMYPTTSMRENRADSPVNGGYSVSPSLAGMSQTSLHVPDNFTQPINVQIFSVHAIEMKSAHTFATNCPSCALACGKSTVNTPVIMNSGSTASWENIRFSFSFDKKNSFRVLILSKDVTIGYCNFSREKLINGKPSQMGNVVVGDLVDQNNRISGKVKVVYGIELPM